MAGIYKDKDYVDAAEAVYNNFNIDPSKDNYLSEAHKDWKVINEFNDEVDGGSGMYACLVDTGDGNCMVVFRGTQPNGHQNAIQDIVFADAGLLNNGETAQQYKARKYAEYIYEQFGDKYKNFTFVGHSLGGNLAEHAAITSPKELQEKSNAVSLDGPGFSKEYINSHRYEIEQMRGKLERHQWTIVGACLNPLPGEEYDALNPQMDDMIDEDIDSFDDITRIVDLFKYNMEEKHIAYDKLCDENGNFIKGDAKDLARYTAVATRISDIIARYNYINNPLLKRLIETMMNDVERRAVGGGKMPGESITVLPKAESYVYIASDDKNCSFEVKCDQFLQYTNTYDTLRNKLRNYVEETKGIANTLGMMDGLYVSKRINNHIEAIEKMAEGMSVLKNKGDSIIERYKKCENICAKK